jgi:hypothetical protein
MIEGARGLPVHRSRLRPRRRWILGAGLIAAAAAAAVALVWPAVDADDERAATGGPQETSLAALKRVADSLDHPVYWSGPPGGRTLELTRTRNGNVFVRYLPAGTAIGDRRPQFTTVGTYPQPGAYARARAAARRPGNARAGGPEGSLVVWSRSRPQSVYVAFPRSDVLVEVYDPDPRRARSLVLSGAVEPVR